MTESTLDNQILLRRTLVTAGAMVGACVLLVGTLTLIALAIVGHAVSPASASEPEAAGASSATVARARPAVLQAPPAQPGKK